MDRELIAEAARNHGVRVEVARELRYVADVIYAFLKFPAKPRCNRLEAHTAALQFVCDEKMLLRSRRRQGFIDGDFKVNGFAFDMTVINALGKVEGSAVNQRGAPVILCRKA